MTDDPRDADGGFTIRAAGASMLTLCASVLSAPPGRMEAADRRRFHAVLVEMLEAARVGGMPEAGADELDALTLAGRVTARSVALAHEAARCAGAAQCLIIANRHGI